MAISKTFHSDRDESMAGEIVRLPLPEPDDSHPLDWYPEDSRQIGLPGTLTETSYTLPEGLNLGEWLAIGETLQRMERSVMWWLGDWWRYGERQYGEMASQASRDMVKDATGYTYQTVRNASIVAAQFESARRRADVPFSYHEAVTGLPAEDADSLLDEVEQTGMKRADLREKVQERKTVISIEAAKAAPMPAPDRIPTSVRIESADARDLPLADGSIHLIVTSPPYGVEKAYEAGGDVDSDDWRAFMYAWLVEAYRVAAAGCRLALNVPLDTTLGGFRPTYSTALQMALAAGWTYRSTIVWMDDQLGKSVARGSVDSATAPHVIAGAEMVPLFSKGAWKREPDDGRDHVEHRGWLEWTNGVWRFPGETNAFGGHPAPFPRELPRRLIRLLSFKRDTVLDPFVGSGTTALEAYYAEREFVGFDLSEQYVKLARRRVAERGAALRLRRSLVSESTPISARASASRRASSTSRS